MHILYYDIYYNMPLKPINIGRNHKERHLQNILNNTTRQGDHLMLLHAYT